MSVFDQDSSAIAMFDLTVAAITTVCGLRFKYFDFFFFKLMQLVLLSARHKEMYGSLRSLSARSIYCTCSFCFCVGEWSTKIQYKLRTFVTEEVDDWIFSSTWFSHHERWPGNTAHVPHYMSEEHSSRYCDWCIVKLTECLIPKSALHLTNLGRRWSNSVKFVLELSILSCSALVQHEYPTKQ
jgi:hypothetical protein